MAHLLLPAARYLITHFHPFSKPTPIFCKRLSPLFPPSLKPTPIFNSLKPRRLSSNAAERTGVLNKDERAGYGTVNSNPGANASTIAAIVTSLGGPPGAVGIVRLSGPSAVAIVSSVFRPGLSKKRWKNFIWKPTSHVVEYGVVLDPNGNVVDEVL